MTKDERIARLDSVHNGLYQFMDKVINDFNMLIPVITFDGKKKNMLNDTDEDYIIADKVWDGMLEIAATVGEYKRQLESKEAVA